MMARIDAAASQLAVGEIDSAERRLNRATEAAEQVGASLYIDRIAALVDVVGHDPSLSL